MAGNGFAIIAAFVKLLSSFILQWQTSKDHENITNSEKDWKMELEKRELLQIMTPHGAKLEKRTQLKYKKERIGKYNFSLCPKMLESELLFRIISCFSYIIITFLK